MSKKMRCKREVPRTLIQSCGALVERRVPKREVVLPPKVKPPPMPSLKARKPPRQEWFWRDRLAGINCPYNKPKSATKRKKAEKLRRRLLGLPDPPPSLSWAIMKAKFDNLCICCGIPEEDTPEGFLTKDHIMPQCADGPDALWNIQPLCGKCNRWKNARVVDFRFTFLELMGYPTGWLKDLIAKNNLP